jgi:hypothetical protein
MPIASPMVIFATMIIILFSTLNNFYEDKTSGKLRWARACGYSGTDEECIQNLVAKSLVSYNFNYREIYIEKTSLWVLRKVSKKERMGMVQTKGFAR